MKRYMYVTLKVLLISLLMFSVFRLASLGASLVREQRQFEKLALTVSDSSVPDTGDTEREEHPAKETTAAAPVNLIGKTGNAEAKEKVAKKEKCTSVYS